MHFLANLQIILWKHLTFVRCVFNRCTFNALSMTQSPIIIGEIMLWKHSSWLFFVRCVHNKSAFSITQPPIVIGKIMLQKQSLWLFFCVAYLIVACFQWHNLLLLLVNIVFWKYLTLFVIIFVRFFNDTTSNYNW